MSNNRYKIYLEDTKKLAATLVIKSSVTPELQNKELITLYGDQAAPEDTPTAWKYYLNLNGQYHLADTMMTVTSLDTLETINFTMENLRIHRATAKAYVYGTRYYKELVTRYPKQETLILGILYPVDMNTAIAAEDGDILGYPSDLVEVQEYSLLTRIQKWIKGYRLRCVNESFNYSDVLYHTVEHSVMYAYLVPAILGFRFEACRTNEAHSFHIREYLASHYGLDKYMDYMTLEQQLFLYRNIKYIQRNVGRNETHDWLVEKLLTERNIPLAEYTVRHIVSGMPDSLVPIVKVRRTPLNLKNIYTTTDLFSLEEYFAKIQSLAPNNETYQALHLDETRSRLERSRSSIVNTKTYESSMIDYSDSDRYQLADVLLMSWLHHSHIGIYDAVVNIVNPKTAETYSLHASDAFLFMLYVYSKAQGFPLKRLPQLVARRVVKTTNQPTVDQMLSLVEKRFWKKAMPKLQSCLDVMPILKRQISVEAFYLQAYALCDTMNKQVRLIAQEFQYHLRAQMTAALSLLYQNVTFEPDDTSSFDTWLADRSIDLSGLTADQLQTLYVSAYQAGTGLELVTTTSLADIQQALLKILETLSSYSVQYLSSVNEASLLNLGNPGTLVGDTDGSGVGHAYVAIGDSNVSDVRGRLQTNVEYSPLKDGVEIATRQSLKMHVAIDVGLTIPAKGVRYVPRYMIDVATQPTITYPDVDVPNGMACLPGVEYLLNAPDDVRNRLKDIYGGGYQ